jgi:hypothetical protein
MRIIYFHSAKQGKKIEILKENKHVCFEIDLDFDIKEADSPCEFSAKYKSVIGLGEAEFITNPQKKREALNIIMDHYTGKREYKFNEEMLKKTIIIKVDILELTGKKSGY